MVSSHTNGKCDHNDFLLIFLCLLACLLAWSCLLSVCLLFVCSASGIDTFGGKEMTERKSDFMVKFLPLARRIVVEDHVAALLVESQDFWII
jgi:hypothetical protein